MCHKCLWYWIHLITVQKEHHQFPFSTSATPTRILLANRGVDHWSYSYLLQIVTRISDQQNLINCNQSDSTHSFYVDLSQCLVRNYIGTQCTHSLETQSNTRLLILFIFINFCIYIHLVSLQMSYKCTKEVNKCRTKQN